MSRRRSPGSSAWSNAGVAASETDLFSGVLEQDAARLLLSVALRDGPAHAYLFHGPAGVGKGAMARAFAAALLGDARRVERGTHPDLYVLEPLGEQIRIGDIHALRRDLHLRPFEAERRVYVVHRADSMNPDAADALLKSLEEPPSYATVVLLADRVALLPETIRSRCQLVPFRRLSSQAVRAWLQSQVGATDEAEVLARVSGGTLERAGRLLDESEAEARRELLALTRAAYRDESFDAPGASQRVLELASARGDDARARARETADESLTQREAEQRERRAGRGAERELILEVVATVASWCRDLLAAQAGALETAINADLAAELAEDAALVDPRGVETALELVLETRRRFELQLQAGLALDAMFVSLQRALARGQSAALV